MTSNPFTANRKCEARLSQTRRNPAPGSTVEPNAPSKGILRRRRGHRQWEMLVYRTEDVVNTSMVQIKGARGAITPQSLEGGGATRWRRGQRHQGGRQPKSRFGGVSYRKDLPPGSDELFPRQKPCRALAAHRRGNEWSMLERRYGGPS